MGLLRRAKSLTASHRRAVFREGGRHTLDLLSREPIGIGSTSGQLHMLPELAAARKPWATSYTAERSACSSSP